MSRLLDTVSARDLEGGGEKDLDTFIKELSIVVYAGRDPYRSD